MKKLIEQIKAEVERRYNKHKQSNAITENVYAEEDKSILSFLDTLQEQPVCEELNDEIYKEKAKVARLFGGVTGEQDRALIEFARHFYELGRQSKGVEWTERDKTILNNIVAYKYLNVDDLEWLKELPERFGIKQSKPKVSEELEEEIKRYGEEHQFDLPSFQNVARHFAQWQAKQDQETIELAEDHAYFAGAVNEREKMMKEAVPFYEILKVVPPGPERDKVRIIIVKED